MVSESDVGASGLVFLRWNAQVLRQVDECGRPRVFLCWALRQERVACLPGHRIVRVLGELVASVFWERELGRDVDDLDAVTAVAYHDALEEPQRLAHGLDVALFQPSVQERRSGQAFGYRWYSSRLRTP